MLIPLPYSTNKKTLGPHVISELGIYSHRDELEMANKHFQCSNSLLKKCRLGQRTCVLGVRYKMSKNVNKADLGKDGVSQASI